MWAIQKSTVPVHVLAKPCPRSHSILESRSLCSAPPRRQVGSQRTITSHGISSVVSACRLEGTLKFLRTRWLLERQGGKINKSKEQLLTRVDWHLRHRKCRANWHMGGESFTRATCEYTLLAMTRVAIGHKMADPAQDKNTDAQVKPSWPSLFGTMSCRCR